MHTLRPCRGLTLLEMAITVAVLAILGAIALPGFGARLERQRTQAAAQALAADITEARFEAARRGQAVYVQASALASSGSAWCWAVATTPGCVCEPALAPGRRAAPLADTTPACGLHSVSAATFPGVRLAAGPAVRMDPGGQSDGGTAATLLTPRGDPLRVDVSPLGRARVCAPAGAGAKAWPQLPVC